jgi:hypothetical protein
LACPRDVRFTPDSDRIADISWGPVRAKTGSRGLLSLKTIGPVSRPYADHRQEQLNELAVLDRMLPQPW